MQFPGVGRRFVPEEEKIYGRGVHDAEMTAVQALINRLNSNVLGKRQHDPLWRQRFTDHHTSGPAGTRFVKH